ncbi:hypothetical protein XPA_001983 [Xanthoria parietina]
MRHPLADRGVPPRCLLPIVNKRQSSCGSTDIPVVKRYWLDGDERASLEITGPSSHPSVYLQMFKPAAFICVFHSIFFCRGFPGSGRQQCGYAIPISVQYHNPPRYFEDYSCR